MVHASVPRQRARRRRQWLWLSLALLAVVAIAFAWLRPRSPAPQRVYLERVERTAFVREVSGTGTVEAARSRVVVFAGTGTVAEVAVSEGDRVDAGALLARLDTRALERELASNRAELASARADLERVHAQQTIDRLDADAAVTAAENRVADATQALADARRSLAASERLYAAGGAARNELDAARAAVDQAARQVEEVQLGLDTARLRQTSFDALAAAQLAAGEATARRLETAIANAEQQRTEAALVAPFAGVVAKVPIKVGDLIVSTTPQGVTVVDDSSVSVLADFDENRAVDLAARQAATITPDAAPELALPAVVTRVDPVAERGGGSSATLRAELAFAPPDGEPLPRGAVRPGYTVTAKVIVRSIPEALVVPLEAIGTDGADSYVFRVRQTEPGRGVAQRVPVEVADRNATLAAVRSADLAAGDRVAATNVDALETGETVVFETAGGGG